MIYILIVHAGFDLDDCLICTEVRSELGEIHGDHSCIDLERSNGITGSVWDSLT